MDRIAVIRLSLKAFVCGLIGLIPMIGFVPAIWAVYCSIVARRRYPNEWNPAEHYLNWGLGLAVIGVALTAVTVPATLLVIAIQMAKDF